MTACMSAIITALGAFLGALLSILASIYIESQRKPKLRFEIEEPPLDSKPTGAITNARFLRVFLCNDPMSPAFKWLGRNAAMQCYGEIQFYHLDKSEIFSKPMAIRWAGSEEPLTYQALPDGKVVPLFDSAKYSASFHRNCFPGTKELIDVAVRFDDDEDCYGWTSENYLKGWRNNEWKLPKGKHLAKVTVHSSGETVSEIFQLENSVARQHFRLLKSPQE